MQRHTVVWSAVGLVLGGLLLSLALARPAYVHHAPLLHVGFQHADHRSVNCLDCHHNYIDDTGSDLCYACHKSTLELAETIQDMFHTFCRDCHVEKQMSGEEAGPVRLCSGCHNPDRPAQ